jgi:hypothetical protein
VNAIFDLLSSIFDRFRALRLSTVLRSKLLLALDLVV